MGWLEARRRYTEGETLATQAVEDLVARRVLRGMGFVGRQVPELEKALGIKSDFNTALWPRTYQLLRSMGGHSGKSWIFGFDRTNPGYFEIDVRETEHHHKNMLDMIPMFIQHKDRPHPLFLTRVKDTQTSLAYYLLRHDIDCNNTLQINAAWLVPPVQFIAEAGPWWIVVQETEHFISQFGPYQSPLEPK